MIPVPPAKLGTVVHTDRVRTLHILTSLDRGGAETFAVQMIDRLDRDRFAPAIWTTRPPATGYPLEPLRTSVLSSHDSGSGHDGGTARSLRELLSVLRRVKPHLVQCHGGRALKHAMAVKPLWRAPAYVYNKILSIHPALDSPVKRFLYSFLFEQVDAIVAVGEQVRREVEDAFHPRRPVLLTISNGRDVVPFRSVSPEATEQARRELGLGPGEVCLMFVGRLAWEKDPQSLLRLCADLAPIYPAHKFVLVGGGPLEPDLKQEAVRLGITDRVRFTGVRRDVPTLMSAADLVLLPSVTEGLPGVLIEAGMAGRPAVAYRIAAVEDVLIDGVTGFVVSPGDTEMFKQRVLHLMRHPELRSEMGDQARRRCRRDFDIEASVKRYEDLFHTLVDGARSRDAASLGVARPDGAGRQRWNW